MNKSTRSAKPSPANTKKAGAKTAPAKTAPRAAANGKMSTTELLRVYFVRPYPKITDRRGREDRDADREREPDQGGVRVGPPDTEDRGTAGEVEEVTARSL